MVLRTLALRRDLLISLVFTSGRFPRLHVSGMRVIRQAATVPPITVAKPIYLE
jgi:hypothetical protein